MNAKPHNKRQQEQKDDREHTTSSRNQNRTGDPGRTPGTAEGDRANVDKWLNDKNSGKKSSRK